MKFVHTAVLSFALSIAPPWLVLTSLVMPSLAAATENALPEGDAGAPNSESFDRDRGSVIEAQTRAKILHETIRGTLQIMHRDFFDEDNAHAIPSASLEDVFTELARSYEIEVKWLVVNTDVVNVDHKPVDEFERNAVKALASGKPNFESTMPSQTPGQSRYRYAGPIRIRSQCLKCHVKRRTSNEERVAGLVISMPVQVDSER